MNELTTVMAVLSIALVMLSGVFKGDADSLAHNQSDTAWRNKWAWEQKSKRHWWYFGLYTPKYTEKFAYSSTLLVFLTDKWHWANFWQYRCVDAAIAVHFEGWQGVWAMLILPVMRGLGFTLSYRK